ncbi:lipase [Pilimelia terevasa]|uniref:Lipase n=1 Tax=Pilimelia terevasa TaxID=53372 RepID=A0A8J3FHE6_9ACTN|nr:alpha/beta hydrolase [Pilimelia terevasa]GGK14041.1 lipase [Pilimelia terevasa]
MRIPRRAGIVSAAVGLAAAGLAAGYAAQRAWVRRSRGGADPYADEPFGDLPSDEVRLVTAADGTDLYVEVVEPTDGIELDFAVGGVALPPADPTIVFVHGFCLDMGTFHFQRRTLTRRGDHRMVFYDQPGHGRSKSLASGEYRLSALGDALRAVIDETTGDGPVVLVGHSMGGMAVMALAERHPDLFTGRVAGVVLMSTSGSVLGGARIGLPTLAARFARPLLPLVHHGARLTGPVIDQARRASADLAYLLTRRYGFGGPAPSPALVSYVERMNARTSAETVARYLRTLGTHARHPALAALRDVPTLVIVGGRDVITPPEHSEEIVQHLPDAALVTVPDSGHVVMLEHPDEVDAALLAFLDRVMPGGDA